MDMTQQEVLEQLQEIGEGIDARIDKRIDKRVGKTVDSLAVRMGAPRYSQDVETDVDGWANFGEMLYNARFNPMDKRLERRAMSAGTGSEGGFLVPELFAEKILQVTADSAIFLPRCQAIGGDADHPDAEINIPALDHSGTNGIAAGVSVAWVAEGGTKTETSPIFANVKLKPSEVAAYVVVTDKLLANTQAASVIVSRLLQQALLMEIENCILQGSGAGQPLGIIGCPAEIVITRTGAAAVEHADMTAMLSRARLGSGRDFIWVISQTVLDELLTDEDTAGTLIWHPDATASPFPGRYLGIPIFVNSGSPVLGAKGDVILVNLQDYVVRKGRDVIVQADPYTYFTSDKTQIRALTSIDGQPWETSPMELQDGSTTVSSFIVLE